MGIKMSTRTVYISMIITAFFWSGAFIAGKLAATIFLPFTLTFFRFLFALPFIFFLLWFKEPAKFIPNKEQLLPLLILGIVGTLGYHFFFFLALRHTTAINSALIGATNPMVTIVLAALFFKEKITLVRLVGVGVSLFGVFSVITNLDPLVISTLQFNQGDFYMSLGVFCFSSYALLSRKYMLKFKISPLTVTAYTFLVCTVLSLVLGLLLENPLGTVLQAPSKVWLEILYMAVFASVVGYYLQLNAIREIGAPKTAMFINLVPVFTIFLAFTFLGEDISLLKIGCAILIIFGVYLASRPEPNSVEGQ
jgi:drug/metabolite transporter (DMT)-like permease